MARVKCLPGCLRIRSMEGLSGDSALHLESLEAFAFGLALILLWELLAAMVTGRFKLGEQSQTLKATIQSKPRPLDLASWSLLVFLSIKSWCLAVTFDNSARHH